MVLSTDGEALLAEDPPALRERRLCRRLRCVLKVPSPVKKLGCLFILLVVVAGAAFKAGQVAVRKTSDATKVVATVDGATLTAERLNKYLPVYRRKATLDLVEQRLIAAAAWKRGIKVDGNFKYPKGAVEEVDFVAFGPYLWSSEALRRLILADWPESKMQATLRDLKDELTEYQLEFFVVRSEEDISNLKVDLSDGLDYESLNASYGNPDLGDSLVVSMSERRQGITNLFVGDLGDLETNFGLDVADELGSAKVGAIVGPIRFQSLTFVCRLKARLDDTKHLQARLERQILQAQRDKLLALLFSKAQITIPMEFGGDLEQLELLP